MPLKNAQDIITFAAKMAGATPAQINAMMAQVKKDYEINVHVNVNTSQVERLRQAPGLPAQ